MKPKRSSAAHGLHQPELSGAQGLPHLTCNLKYNPVKKKSTRDTDLLEMRKMAAASATRREALRKPICGARRVKPSSRVSISRARHPHTDLRFLQKRCYKLPPNGLCGRQSGMSFILVWVSPAAPRPVKRKQGETKIAQRPSRSNGQSGHGGPLEETCNHLLKDDKS